MIIERQKNGSYLITDTIKKERIKQVYYFYSKKDAIKHFKNLKKKQVKNPVIIEYQQPLAACNQYNGQDLKYIYLYLSGNAQASFQTQGTSEKFHKKGTGESTGE